jgi:hypothetical protein
MADVFLSYKREDLPRVRLIVHALSKLGLSVWFDNQLAAGESFRDAILSELDTAKAVLVLWTPASIASEWVRAEAIHALDQEKLIPAFLEPVEVPVPFNVFHSADLTDWDGSDPTHAGWLSLIRRVAELTGKDDLAAPRIEARIPDEPEPGSQIEVDPKLKYSLPFRTTRQRVFVAHASADKGRIGPFVEMLVELGFEVWIDKPYELAASADCIKRLSRNRIHYGADWKESIRIAIRKCDRVIAFWSLDAVEGRREQFHYEVYQGLMQGKLRQCRLDKVGYTDIGFPYTFHHIADLSVVSPAAYHQAFQDFLLDIRKNNPN